MISNKNKAKPTVSSSNWAKIQQIETFVGYMDNDSNMIGERKKLIILHYCDNKKDLIEQLQTMIIGLESNFEDFTV